MTLPTPAATPNHVPTRVDANALTDVLWDDPMRGRIRFRTLFSVPETATHGLVCGVATLRSGDNLALHSHPEPEVYFGLEGAGEVMVDGTPHPLGPGVALYIPGGAVHGVVQASGHLHWFYTFAADSFADIRYHFPHET